MSKKIKLSNGDVVKFSLDNYFEPADRICVKVVVGEGDREGAAYATLSSNFPESEVNSKKGEFFIKYWGENDSMFRDFVKLNVFEKGYPRVIGDKVIGKIRDEFVK